MKARVTQCQVGSKARRHPGGCASSGAAAAGNAAAWLSAPSVDRNRFSGLMSRCTTSALCSALSVRSSGATTCSGAGGGGVGVGIENYGSCRQRGLAAAASQQVSIQLCTAQPSGGSSLAALNHSAAPSPWCTPSARRAAALPSTAACSAGTGRHRAPTPSRCARNCSGGGGKETCSQPGRGGKAAAGQGASTAGGREARSERKAAAASNGCSRMEALPASIEQQSTPVDRCASLTAHPQNVPGSG